MNRRWIRIDIKNTSCFFNRENIAGISISADKPTQLCILMIGDENPTVFTFPTVEERNNKLTEIFGDEYFVTAEKKEEVAE